ncbi:MAG: hypothetical protein WA628_13340 [Terriglobales bacterium]
MSNKIRRVSNGTLVFILSSAMVTFAEPLPQSVQELDQTRPAQVPDVANAPQPSNPSPDHGNSATPPVHDELPDAPAPARPAQHGQSDSLLQQAPNSVPSGTAGAKAPTVKGAPASRPVGAAIAPAKQRQRRSLLIKAGLIAGACVAVGSAFALSKGSPSKPPGAP